MPTDPKRVQSLFLAATALPAADRPAFLDRQCDDPELRRRVEALLAAHDEPDSFLERPAVAPVADTSTFAADPPPDGDALPPTVPHIDETDRVGEVVAGRYKLLEPIGEGGMGSVWMAEQREPVRRLVAVKLIKLGMDSKTVLARFEAERQALAMMDHPNIAKVLDGGTTADGRPFFVMELVKGIPITKYCDEAKLTPRERLELFVPVCQAIQHAHQKGVIHRDIKPSNVLIALYDGRPVPKVIDFGIAKATGQALTDRTLHTGFGAVVGTPEYMAPEQAEFNQLDVDTRSDIYSLGVLLYELLTGSTPFDRTRLGKAAILEILRIVREEEPPRPSTKLSTAGAIASIAANRRTEPRKLTALIKGELDWIVMKCLEKDRVRRYETANALAGDVQRYLADEPVQARAPSAGYRLRKFAKRHRGPVLAATVMGLLLIGGVVGTTIGMIGAIENGRLAVRERDAAQREREAADHERMAAIEAQRLAANAEADAIEAKKAAILARSDEQNARQQAERERDAKTAALVRIDGLRLGSEGSLIRTSNPALSLLLGLEGVKRYPHPLTFTALYAAATELREVRTIPTPRAPAKQLRLSPDESRLLVASEGSWDGKVATVYDVASRKPVGGWHGFRHELEDVNFSPDGKRAVAATSGRATVVYTDKRKPGQQTFTERVGYVWDVESGKDVLHLRGPADKFVPFAAVASLPAAATLPGHTDKIVTARYSPDGAKILTASWDATARLWDAATGKQLRVLRGHKQSLQGATFSPDGKRVLTVSLHQNHTAGYIDFDGVPRPRRPEEGEVDPGVTDRPFVANSWGSGYSTWGFDEPEQPFARVWDAETGTQVAALGVRRGTFDFLDSSTRWGRVPTSFAFSPDGKRIAVGFQDGTLRLWDAEAGDMPLTLRGHKQRVVAMAFRPDGRRLVTAGAENPVIVWDVEAGQEARRLVGFEATTVNTVRYSADGTKVLAAAADRTARVWEAETGKELASCRGHTSPIAGAEFLPDGKTVVTAGDSVRFWSIAAPPPIATELRAATSAPVLSFGGDRRQHTSEVTVLAFTPDGKGVVTGSGDRTVRLWDAATGRHLKGVTDEQVRGEIRAIAVAPDGKSLYFGTSLNFMAMVRPANKETALSMVHRWDLGTGSVTRHLKNFSRAVHHLSLSRDGKRLMVVSGSEGLGLDSRGYLVWSSDNMRTSDAATIWDAGTGTRVAAIDSKGGQQGGPPPVLSPDGNLVLFAHMQPVHSDPQGHSVHLALYDAYAGQLVRTLANPPSKGVGSNRWDVVALSPDGRTVVAQRGGTRATWFWDVATGRVLGSYESPTQIAWGAPRIAVSPDSKVLGLATDRTVILVDVATRTELRQLRGHEERVSAMAFAPDGAKLLTGSEDGSAILWDVATGGVAAVYKGHAGPVKLVAYSPDGTRVATASTEPFARVWPVDLLPEFERRKTRELTAAERSRYELSEQAARR